MRYRIEAILRKHFGYPTEYNLDGHIECESKECAALIKGAVDELEDAIDDAMDYREDY